MWPLLRSARTLTPILGLVAAVLCPQGLHAQGFAGNNNPYSFNNQTYSYGLQLPQVPQPNGQDEIRAADGTTCRSSMASNDAYLDVGGIGGQGNDGSFSSGTVYGRLIVPLGGVPKRLDCSSLYALEIERLKHELNLVRAGLSGGGFEPSQGQASSQGKKSKGWAEEGWSNKGFKASASATTNKASSEPSASIPAATVVPMRLRPKPDPATATAEPSDVEYLPWSSEPAVGARVMTSMSSTSSKRSQAKPSGVN